MRMSCLVGPTQRLVLTAWKSNGNQVVWRCLSSLPFPWITGIMPPQEGERGLQWCGADSVGSGSCRVFSMEGYYATYRGYWTQCNSRFWDSMQVCLWESANSRSEAAQIILYQSKVREILKELRAESSVGHLGIERTLDKDRSTAGYTWRITWRVGANYVTSAWQAKVPEPRANALCINVILMHHLRDQTRYLMSSSLCREPEGNSVSSDCYGLILHVSRGFLHPNHGASAVADVVTVFFCLRVLKEVHSDQGWNFQSRCYRKYGSSEGAWHTPRLCIHSWTTQWDTTWVQ